MLALLVALAGPAEAREEPWCAASVGAAGAIAPAGRGFDLSTPGPVAWSVSPVGSASCHTASDALWVGVDASPWLQHSYGWIGSRGPVLLTASAGASFATPYGDFGPYAFSNRAAGGLGARWSSGELLDRSRFEVRLAWMAGRNPDFQATVAVDLLTWTSPDGLAGVRLGPPSDEGPRLVHGFEVGSLVGYRGEVRFPWSTPHAVGLRAGVLYGRRSGTALQPTALLYADIPADWLHVQVAGGATLRDGAVRPIGGVAAVFHADDTWVGMQTGLLVGGGERAYVVADAGLFWMW